MPDRPDPGLIMGLATDYWNSAALLAANELNLFGALAAEPQTAAQVAARLGTPLRSTRMLLDACAGLKLLSKQPSIQPFIEKQTIEGQERQEGQEEEKQAIKAQPASEEVEQEAEWVYANSPDAAAFLVPGQPGYLGGAIVWGADQYAAWGDLAHAVRTNKPAVEPGLHLGDNADQTRRFVLGMHNRALSLARGVLHFLPLANVTNLLDVGGGPGTYAMLLAQKYPQLYATVLDLPGVVAIARELIAQAGLADRVQTLPGSAEETDWQAEAYNGVLFSGVLHQMDAQTIQALFAKAHRALQPGGKLVVSDIMLDASKTQPVFATLFSLQMLLTSQAGAVFSDEECTNWLQQAGFTAVHAQTLPPPLPYTVISTEKGE